MAAPIMSWLASSSSSSNDLDNEERPNDPEAEYGETAEYVEETVEVVVDALGGGDVGVRSEMLSRGD